MTPEQEEQVRRVLASTPPEEPMPPEVVARLDETLAGLVAHRADAGGAASDRPGVTDLEARRRRRWPQVLVAAASVAVIGYGATAVISPTGGGDASTASRDETFAQSEGADDSGGEAADPETASAPPEDGAVDRLLAVDVVLLRTDTLRRDLRHLLTVQLSADEQDFASRDRRTAEGNLGACVVPDLRPDDELAAVRLDGRRATLVVRAPQGGTRVAQVHQCDDPGEVLARVELPVRP